MNWHRPQGQLKTHTQLLFLLQWSSGHVDIPQFNHFNVQLQVATISREMFCLLGLPSSFYSAGMSAHFIRYGSVERRLC